MLVVADVAPVLEDRNSFHLSKKYIEEFSAEQSVLSVVAKLSNKAKQSHQHEM